MTDEQTHWTEANSRTFIDYGRYFVPEREQQTAVLTRLVPDPGGPFEVLELACGAGSLAGAMLETFPNCTLVGLDGSDEMLRAAGRRLAGFGQRFKAAKFDLFTDDWRHPEPRYQAVLSSLAIHHLDDAGKARLFRDLYPMLRPGGALLIADILRPAGPQSAAYAAGAYDDIVRRQSLALDGNLAAFEQFEADHWNLFRYPDDPIDRPSTLLDQLKWLEEAGFQAVDTFWLRAGHAIFGGFVPAAPHP